MKASRRLARFLANYRLWVILAPLMMLIEVAMDLMQPRLTQRIIDQGIAVNDLDVVIETGALMIALAVAGMVAGVLCGVFAIRAGQGFGADVRSALFSKVQSLSFGNLDRLETGSLITRLTTDVTQLTDAVIMMLRIMVRAPLLLVGSLAMGIATSPRLSLLFLVLLPVIAAVIAVIFRRAFPLFKAVQDRLDRINTLLEENLQGVRVVKAFARHRYETSRFGGRNDDLRDANLSAMFLMVGVMPIMMLIINLGIVAALWFGGRFVDQGRLEIGELVAFYTYMITTMFGLMMVSMVTMRFTRAEASAQRVNEVFDQVPEIVDPAAARAVTPEAGPRGEVRFEDVTFRYAPDSAPVLDGVSFVAAPGSVTAILGMTGSGKSSLVNLIPRFYDVQEGRVLIDGVDIRDVDQETLRDNIAMVLQETVLFSGTVRDNIRFGRPDATEGEIVAAAKAAQADPFIQELPEKYDSIVGQRGVNLSGGQKQRLAIARALVRQAPILILDDSTSAVDVATERRIQESLAKLDLTTIMVAQRISAVVNADTILVLDDGRIVAEGTHDELMRTSAVYRDIYDSQIESGAAYGTA